MKSNEEQYAHCEDNIFGESSDCSEEVCKTHKENRCYKLFENRKFIIKLDDPWRIKWDIIVMILSIWNSVTTPIEVAFKPESFDE